MGTAGVISSPSQVAVRPPKLGAALTFEAYGVRFSIRTAEDWVMVRIREFLPLQSVEIAAPDRVVCYALDQTPDGFYWRLRRQCTIVLQTRSILRALHALRGLLVEHVGRYTTGLTWVHAGAVGWQGRAILIPGESFAGKSTLVTELVKAGADYYSDEIAMLDEHGLLHAYPRPPQLRGPGLVEQPAPPVAKKPRKVASRDHKPIPVGVVVFARFVFKGPRTARPLTPGAALALGLRYTFCARQSPVQALQAWSRAVEGAISWRWDRGDASQAAILLLEAAERRSLPLER